MENTFMLDIIKILLGAIVSLFGYWLAIGKNLVTRDEVHQMIQKEAPYLQDKKLILESVIKNTRLIEVLNQTLNELKIEMAKLNTKLEK